MKAKNIIKFIFTRLFPFWIGLILLFFFGWQVAINTLFGIGLFIAVVTIASIKDAIHDQEFSPLIYFAIYSIILIVPKFFEDFAIAADERNEYKHNQRIEETYFLSIKNGAPDSILADYLNNHSPYLQNGRGNIEHYNHVQNLLYLNKLSEGIKGLNQVINGEFNLDSLFHYKARHAIDSLCDKYYKEALRTNTLDSWEKYQTIVNPDLYKDSQDRITSLERRYWTSDNSAWELASKRNSLEYYQKYLDYYPSGKRSKEAINIIVSLLKKSKNELPPLTQTASATTKTSYVAIKNSTNYKLFLYFSGNDSRYISISANSSGGIRLINGTYHCVATVKNENVSGYTGTETLTGGNYQIEFYIESPMVKYYYRKYNMTN